MKQLTDAVRLGPITTRNRIAVPPMVCFNWTDDSGLVSDRHIAHYKALAEGGAGLIIVEATCIAKRGRLHETQLGLWEDGQVAGFRRLTEAVHHAGAPVLVQLHHAGVNGIDPEAACPSDFAPFGSYTRGVAMTQEQIAQTVQAFADAAVRAKAAGFDGVELHGCHSYLLCQFLNRRVNLRSDRYGTQEELMALEVLRAVRRACGPDFAVGIRLGAFEPTLTDGVRHARALAPEVDFIDVSYGFGGRSDPKKPEDFPFSAAFYGAMKIKEALPETPVFGVDGLRGGDVPEQVLARTGLDLLDAGRASLVDPSFAADVLAGRDTGACLRCKGGCHWSPAHNHGEVLCPGRTLFLRDKEGTTRG